MADYLAVPLARQERVVHEKARSARRGDLRWIRSYRDDFLDDPDLVGEPLALRWIDAALVHWASGSGWLIRYDVARIALRFGVRSQHVRPYLERLLELRRFELVTVDESANGATQPALFPTFSTASRSQVGVESDAPHFPAASEPPAQPSQKHGEMASARLAQNRSREELDLRQGLEGSKEKPSGISNETINSPIVARLIGIAKLDPASASARFVSTETNGLPDAAIVSVIESLLRKRPRPRNPAGWIVNALRAQRRERADPEPEL